MQEFILAGIIVGFTAIAYAMLFWSMSIKEPESPPPAELPSAGGLDKESNSGKIAEIPKHKKKKSVSKKPKKKKKKS